MKIKEWVVKELPQQLMIFTHQGEWKWSVGNRRLHAQRYGGLLGPRTHYVSGRSVACDTTGVMVTPDDRNDFAVREAMRAAERIAHSHGCRLSTPWSVVPDEDDDGPYGDLWYSAELEGKWQKA